MSPTSLEQIFHTFAKEQTGAEEQGVYDNKKELALTELLDGIGQADGARPAGPSPGTAESLVERFDIESFLDFSAK